MPVPTRPEWIPLRAVPRDALAAELYAKAALGPHAWEDLCMGDAAGPWMGFRYGRQAQDADAREFMQALERRVPAAGAEFRPARDGRLCLWMPLDAVERWLEEPGAQAVLSRHVERARGVAQWMPVPAHLDHALDAQYDGIRFAASRTGTRLVHLHLHLRHPPAAQGAAELPAELRGNGWQVAEGEDFVAVPCPEFLLKAALQGQPWAEFVAAENAWVARWAPVHRPGRLAGCLSSVKHALWGMVSPAPPGMMHDEAPRLGASGPASLPVSPVAATPLLSPASRVIAVAAAAQR